MIKVNVKLDIQGARRMFKGMEKEVNKAAGAALQRVAVTARKEADQAIRQRSTLKSTVVKNALLIQTPMGARTLIRDIVATGKPIPLRDYQARKTGKGVTFAIVPGSRKVYRRRGRAGFILDKIGGHVFVRVTPDPPGPPRAKIAKRFGPSITHRFGTRRIEQILTQTVNTRFPIEFKRQLDYRFGP